MDTPLAYIPRIADNMLQEQLAAAGVVLVQGPKWCGKTTTAEQQTKSVLYLDAPKTRQANLLLAETDPEILFQGDTPRLMDEWQLAPKLWDAARFEVSRRRLPGQFIFTGSSVPPDMSQLTHSGTGRFAWLTMRPMSLHESGESNGVVSLEALFKGDVESAIATDISLHELAYLICRGGWPGSLSLTSKAALRQAINYVEAVANRDISRVDGVVHLRNGSFGLIEIKLGGDSLIETGANTLKQLADKIDTTKMRPPSFLMVLTGVGQYAYRRKDGVYVVPIGCLKD